MKRLIATFALCSICFAQRPDKNTWRTVPKYESRPNRVVAFLKRHPAVGLGIGSGIGVAIALKTRQFCHHYPPGENGVGVPCPKEYK